MPKRNIHYITDRKGETYCGKSTVEPDRFSFSSKGMVWQSPRKEEVTCNKCQKRLKKEGEIQQRMKDYQKNVIGVELDDSNDNWILGYGEAINNMLGEFTNGQCDDCPFSYESGYHTADFILPEYELKCSLERCWINSVKSLIRGETT